MQTAFSPSQSRFPLADPATVTDATVRAVFAEIERELGFGIVPNLFRAMAAQPAVLRDGMPIARAIAILSANEGPQWDPTLIPLFCRLYAE